MSIIFISYIIQFMISDFNENWSALLKSIISSGIDEIIYYKKMLSNEYQKIKDQKNENTDIDIAIIGKKSTDKKNYDENGNEVDVEIINENNDNKLDKFNKLLNGDDNIDYDSDDNEDEEDECEELEESSYSSEENNKDKDKILSRDEVLNKIFEKNNKENRIDDDTFFVKKVRLFLSRISIKSKLVRLYRNFQKLKNSSKKSMKYNCSEKLSFF